MNRSVKVYGYSERGILNSLLHEILYSNNGDELLYRLISNAVFPLCADKPPRGVATVLVEQSLSDFGTADVIVLISTNTGNSAVFVEAKVQTAQTSGWQLCDQFSNFESDLELIAACSDSDYQRKLKRRLASSLFTQLYQKQRLISVLKDSEINILEQGIEFPTWSTKATRSIGKNPVVHRAVRLIQPYANSVFYLALIPETDVRAARFFDEKLRTKQPATVPDWDPTRYGFLTWATVESYCHQYDLAATLELFAYNDGQIFRERAN